MAIDLRNIKSKVLSSTDKVSILSEDSNTKQLKPNKPAIISSQVEKNNKLSKSQWGILFYLILLLSLISYIIFIDWSNIWQLPKAIIFILGTTGLLVLSSILWIFGWMKHSVKINLGDIILVVVGISIVIVSFLNTNQIAFWGSSARIFDSGLFLGFLIIFYILLKLFLETKTFNILLLLFACISLIGLLIGSISIYIPNFISLLPIITKLQPTNTWLTESPQELVFISLLVFNIIFLFFSKNQSKNILNKVLLLLYFFSLFIHIVLLIRLPDYSIYILTIFALLVNAIIYTNRLVKNNINTNIRIVVSRVSFVYGVIGITLIALAIIRPFQNNSKFPEYIPLTVPNIDTTISITRQSLKSDTWFGSGNIMYAWNKFTPSVNETQISDFSFETLYSEIFNIVVRNGLIVCIFIVIFAIWILGTLLRLLLVHKTIPVETYTLLLSVVGLFLLPFTIVTKILFILVLVLWSSVVSKYFRPIININLDINKLPASISSLLTFLILFSIAISVLVSTKFYNIMKSQEYVVKASQVQNNLEEQVDLLAKAQNKSPYIIEYAHIYIPALIQKINEKAIELSNSSQDSDNRNIDTKKQGDLQAKITEAQFIIDQYRKNFPSDTRVIYWQLDLYSTVHKYGIVDENEFIALISKGRDLQKNSLYWDIYEAQYYARQAQKEQKINIEQLNKAKTILKSLIEKNIYFMQAYQNYYDVLSLNQEYTEQINILNKYIDTFVSNDLIANQELVYLLGVAYQNNKQYNEAIDVYNKLIEIIPNYTNVYFKLGEIYEAQKKTDLAKNNYQKVLELDPSAEEVKIKLENLN